MFGWKRKNSSYPFSSLKKPKKRKSGIHKFSVEKTRSLALNDLVSYYNQDEWLLKDTSPANETVEQPATSASLMKILLENIDLWGSVACLFHFKISSFWLLKACF